MDAEEPPFDAVPRVIGGRYGLASKEMMSSTTLARTHTPWPRRWPTTALAT
jgi:hypothetical protein